jgi:hypothetical protein
VRSIARPDDFHLRHGVNPGGSESFFLREHFCKILSAPGVPAPSRISLVKTMVATHLPSNVLLIPVPIIMEF